MELYEKLDILGKAFSNGETDKLAGLLDENCSYNSDYAHRKLTSAKDILDSMRRVYETVQQQVELGMNVAYSYTVIDLNSVFNESIDLYDLNGTSLFDISEKGLLLFQFEAKEPVAVVFIRTNSAGYITEINLSRNRAWFNLSFYGEYEPEDSENDIPYTVKPMSFPGRQAKKMQSVRIHRKPEYENLDDTEVYIWRNADKYIKHWLKDNGYYVIETQAYDDCIGYRCSRKNCTYTLYMYAYGQNKTARLDGDYCAKLLDNNFSAKSTVLVAYLNVKRFKDGDEIKYFVGNYSGDESNSIELWKINEVNGKMILEFYPRKEITDAIYRLMYAFNRDNRDVYDCIMCDKSPYFDGIGSTGVFMNGAFYANMFRLHKKHGDMKIGYVRFNDVVYSRVPYIEGYGYFGLQVDNSTDKILGITAYPFEGREGEVAEFIKTDEREIDSWYSNIPAAVDVKALAPVFTERFALKLTFDNGECKKYVLPIDNNFENDEVVGFDRHVFTDKIWSTAVIEKSSKPHRGMAVCFANEYAISVMKCYEEGTPYVEPELCGELVYEDDKCAVEKCWKWNVSLVREDEETGLLKALISDSTFNCCGVSTFASRDGKRLTGIDFDFIDNFHEGLAKVKKSGYGYGFVDKDMHLVIPMIYENANMFKNGRAKVKHNGKWMYIDKSGKEIETLSAAFDSKYKDVGEFNEGMCKVSTLKLGFMDLAYYSNCSEIAGTWGFINESGEEIVAPQYIYAEDFYSGVAVVCKGKWTVDEKWNNKYWTEEELWGAIDKCGNEVVPFIFDEIKHFWDIDDVFMVHYGGWETGRWGVIDNHGNWLADPIFENIDYEYHDGLFAFCKGDGYDDDMPLGIYDAKQKRVIFEPQFFDVNFLDDGWIDVEVFDEKLGRRVEKLIDRNGNEKFHSVYTHIYNTWKKPYEVVIRDENGDRRGLIDENGNVILPCEYNISPGGISYEQGLIVFLNDGKQGVKDFTGKIIIEPKYSEIHSIDKSMLIVRIGEEDNYKEGMISKTGKDVIPVDFKTIRWLKDNYFICCKNGLCEMYRLTDKT